MLDPLRSVAAALLAAIPLHVADAAQAPMPVAVVLPSSGTLSDDLRLTGTLTAERSARLSPRVDGLVSAVKVDAGDRVKRGEVLLELDAAVARHALNRAEASTAEAAAALKEAERLVAEARKLTNEGHIPQTEAARRNTQAQAARAALEASEAAQREQAELVRRHALPAPFAGVIARKLTEVGEWVTRGTPVLELVSAERVRLDVQAPQEQFLRIDSNAKVAVLSDALPGKTLPARIVARVPVSDASARTFLVRMLVDDPRGLLLPGTSATAVIDLSGERQALVVPRDALLRYPDGSHTLFVVRGSGSGATAQERKVTIRGTGANVEILSGLAAGERVVVRGNEALRDGQPVRVADDS